MASFAFNRRAELPAFLNGPEGLALADGLGAPQDAELPLLRMAALARLPFYCPDDALDGVGAWLQIERFPGEPHGTAPVGSTPGTGYRGRLCEGFSTWEIAASPEAIEQSLRSYGVETVRVIEAHELTFAPSQTYSMFCVLVGPVPSWVALTLGAFSLGGPETLGSTATSSDVEAIRRQVKKWKSHQARPIFVIVVFETGADLLGVDMVLRDTVLGAGDAPIYWTF